MLFRSLRTAEGIELAEAGRLFGTQRLAKLEQEARRMAPSGMVRLTDERLSIPPERFLVSDAVIGALFETR